MWVKLKDLNLEPSRNLGYSVFFQTVNYSTCYDLCEDCVRQNKENNMLYLKSNDPEIVEDAQEKLNQEYYEKANNEDFTKMCDNCQELIGADYIPNSKTEMIEFLVNHLGWCQESAEQYSQTYFESNTDYDVIPDDLYEVIINAEYYEPTNQTKNQ